MRASGLVVLAALVQPTWVAAAPQSAAPVNREAIGGDAIIGNAIKLSDYKGRWVVLNYWATWCAPCIAEMPILSTQATSRPQLVVIGVTTEAITSETLAAFLRKHPVAYPIIVIDKSNTPIGFSGSWLGMQARPLTYVVRPDGTLAKRFVGGITETALNAVLDGPAR